MTGRERALRARGGPLLLLAPTSSIGPEVPAENIHAMYEHARSYVPTWRRAAPSRLNDE